MTRINTAHYRRVNREDSEAGVAARLNPDGRLTLLDAVAAEAMVADGPDLRRNLLAYTESWCGINKLKIAARLSVLDGVESVLAAMVRDGLLETARWGRSHGRWKFVKKEKRPLMSMWRRTAAGEAELRRMILELTTRKIRKVRL